jgi:predicted HicB family RNase H-like nuclease
VESNPEKDSISTGGLEDPTHLNNQTSKLMDKLQTPSKEATKRFTVDLAQSTHRKLSILAAKTGRSKADIVRVLIDDALEDIPE